MSELITGVISGVVASIVVCVFLLLVRPKISVSNKACKASEGEDGTFIRIKVVNRTRSMLTNVKYVLNFCQSQGEGVHQVEVIPPCKAPSNLLTSILKATRMPSTLSGSCIRFRRISAFQMVGWSFLFVPITDFRARPLA